jgi:hypothetical protein
VSRASWVRATGVQRRQADAYAGIVASIPSIPCPSRGTHPSRTPYLDQLLDTTPNDPRAASAVFVVAVEMVGRAHAAVAADDLIRLAPEVRASRMSPLDARNIAVARAVREGRAEQATDLVGYPAAQVFELHSPIVAPSPMLAPELIETVTGYVRAVYGRSLTAEMCRVLDVGLPVVVELIESYPAAGERPPGAVLVSMQRQQCARNGRCLVSLYREQGLDDRVAIALARLLAGRSKDPRTSLLWHALRHTPPAALPLHLVRQVRRDISDLDQSQFADDIVRKRFRDGLGRSTSREWEVDAGAGRGQAVGQ